MNILILIPLVALPDVLQLVTGKAFEPPDMKQYLLPIPSALKIIIRNFNPVLLPENLRAHLQLSV